jgi:hypothetical protein
MSNIHLNKICNKHVIYTSQVKYKVINMHVNQYHYYLSPSLESGASMSLIPESELLSRPDMLEINVDISALSNVSLSRSSRCVAVPNVNIVSKTSKSCDTFGREGQGSMDGYTSGGGGGGSVEYGDACGGQIVRGEGSDVESGSNTFGGEARGGGGRGSDVDTGLEHVEEK